LKQYKVVILNDAGMHYIPNEFYLRLTEFNFASEFNGCTTYKYKDEVFPFYQNDVEMPDVDSIGQMIERIQSYNPALVLNVGASCLVSDLCRGFTKTACIPCGTDIPVSEAEYQVLCREIKEKDKIILDRLDNEQKIITSVFNYIMPDETCMKQYNREDLCCPNNAWIVATVGNRLSLEITDSFMKMIDEVLSCSDDLYFVAIGAVDNPEKMFGLCDNFDRIRFIGDVTNASQIIKYCNLYIQPHRQGGGRAAFEAMYYGVPVVTTNYGDTWNVCGDDFSVADYSEMKKAIIHYHADSDFYDNKRKIATERAHNLENMLGMMQKVFVDLGL